MYPFGVLNDIFCWWFVVVYDCTVHKELADCKIIGDSLLLNYVIPISSLCSSFMIILSRNMSSIYDSIPLLWLLSVLNWVLSRIRVSWLHITHCCADT